MRGSYLGRFLGGACNTTGSGACASSARVGPCALLAVSGRVLVAALLPLACCNYQPVWQGVSECKQARGFTGRQVPDVGLWDGMQRQT